VGTAERPRLVLAGGCGSSGTTLLANLLGRHPAVVAAPEFDVFNHAEMLSLDALRTGLDALFARRRLSHGFKLVVSFLTPSAAVGIDRATVERWLVDAKSIEDVYARFAAHMCAERGAACFVEKTPTNVYSFRAFAREHPGVPLIHQIRDGRDVAASLVKRGKTLFYAGSRWLYDTAAGMAARGASQYMETRYESLVSDAPGTLRTVLAHLGLEYDAAMLEATASAGASTYEEQWRAKRSAQCWQSTPQDPISPSSVGRHRQVLTREQLATLSRIRLTARAAAELGSGPRSFGELLEHLGYRQDEPPVSSRGMAARIRELGAELADHGYRARRSLRYTHRLPVIVTTGVG
jgi:hypothetical protein